jgi:hypothetical protein
MGKSNRRAKAELDLEKVRAKKGGENKMENAMEIALLQSEVAVLKNQVADLAMKLTEGGKKNPAKKTGNKVGRWNICKTVRGQYIANRTINGQARTVYIGVNPDQETAREKITAKGYPID